MFEDCSNRGVGLRRIVGESDRTIGFAGLCPGLVCCFSSDVGFSPTPSQHVTKMDEALSR